jgi:cell division protein FtsB
MKKKVILIALLSALPVLFLAFMTIVSACSDSSPEELRLSDEQLQKEIKNLQEGNANRVPHSLKQHYIFSYKTDMVLFYGYVAATLDSRVFSIEINKAELEKYLDNDEKIKRFVDNCSIDDYCASSDIYQHYYSIYQSLPDENKTAIDQAISKQDRDKTEQETESCGFFASIRKFFSCG